MSTAEEIIRILEGNDDEEFLSDDELDINEPLATGSSLSWSTEESPRTVEEFDDFVAGLSPNISLTESSSELDIFEHFANEHLLEHIVQCTNRYHQSFVRNTDLRVYSRLHRWTDVSVPEMYLFLSISMLMTRNRHLTIEEHWATDPLLSSPIFGKLMSRNRYVMILGMLCFYDINSSESTSNSRLIKIEFIVDHARKIYKQTFVPHKKLCIDESIVPFKGRLGIKQYMPNKRNRFGIKLFVLCDVATGFIIDFIVYCGATTDVLDIPELGKSGSVVVKLLQDYFHCHRQLYVDNWYSSPALFMYLRDKLIYACGTVKSTRRGMPVFKKIRKGEVDVHYCPPLTALRWRDKKNVTMLSTMHGGNVIPSNKVDRATGLPKMKPQCVIDYSENMGSVDTMDMMISSLTTLKKTIKWHKKIFFRVFDMHLLNSLYTIKILKSTNLKFADFQLRVIRQIIEKYKGQTIMAPSTSQRRNVNDVLRLLPGDAAKHMPKRIPQQKSQRCKVCARNNRRTHTRFYCAVCNVYLCVDPCARLYHEEINI